MGRSFSIVVGCLMSLFAVAVLVIVVVVSPFVARPSFRGAAHGAFRDEYNAGFSVYLDGSTRTFVPRKVLGGPPAEMFYSIPLRANPSIRANKSGYAFIPKLTTIKVSYVRDLPFIGGFEYGTANWKWNANPVTVFSDKVVAGTAEKMLTLSHKGFWRTDSKDYALKQRSEQNSFTRWLASKTGWYRSFLVNSFAIMANPGVQLRDAALTQDTYKDLRNYVVKDNATPPESMWDRMDVWRANLTAEAADMGKPSWDELDQTAVNCFHIEGTTGAYWGADGLYIPLGKKIAVYRGQIAQGPLRTFNVASGVAVVDYNQRDQRLEIYFYANNYLNVLDPLISNLPPPALYTSVLPLEHISSIVPDTRLNSVMQAPSTAMKALYDRYMSMPVDYEYLFRDPTELCSDDQRRKWGDMFQTLDFGKFVHGHGEKPSAVEALNMVREMTDTIDCATSYLQAKVDNSNAYDLMEAIGWGHFIMETPPEDTMKVTAYRHWNDFTIVDSTTEGVSATPSKFARA